MGKFERALEILRSIEGRIVVGVSGGVDSMCLLDLVLKSGIGRTRVNIAHINHNLRENAQSDCDFVVDFCAKNGLRCEVFSVNIRELCLKSGLSEETQARIARHEIFDSLLESGGVILLAHTASDQAETLLMHMLRGCGIDGLRGMGERDGMIIRPLIGVSRREIEEYARENNIAFVVDESNFDTKYDRNFVRKMLGDFEERFGGATNNICRLSGLVREHLGQISLDEEYFSEENGVILLKKAALASGFSARYVLEAVKRAGLKSDYESKHIYAVIDLAQKQVGRKINLPHGLIAQNERENIAFFWEKSECFCGEVAFCEGENQFFGRKIVAKSCEIAVKRGEIIVDADRIRGAVIRFRRDGDIFIPCGGRRKKLKEYLNSARIENRVKDDLPLICAGNEVLVICGVELSDSVKITEKTSRALRIFYGKN